MSPSHYSSFWIKFGVINILHAAGADLIHVHFFPVPMLCWSKYFFRDGSIVHRIFLILFGRYRWKNTILHMCYQLQNLYLGSWPVQYLFIDPTSISTWFFCMISLLFIVKVRILSYVRLATQPMFETIVDLTLSMFLDLWISPSNFSS